MIAKVDVDSLEKLVGRYREYSKTIDHLQNRLEFFESRTNSTNSSFNVHDRSVDVGDGKLISYTLEAGEIIPIIKDKLLKFKQARTALKIPVFNSCTEVMGNENESGN